MLEVLKQFLDPSRYPTAARLACKQLTRSLVEDGELYQRICQHILYFSPDRKAALTLGPAINVALAPLRTLPPGERRQAAFNSFASHILTLPLLPNRLPATALAKLSTEIAPAELLKAVTRTPTVDEAPYLLANLVALFENRLSTFDKATVLVDYLQSLRGCLDALPSGALLDPGRPAGGKGKGREVEHHAMDVDEPVELAPSHSDLDHRVRPYLHRLYSPSHLTALTTASNRFASSPTSRPVFSAFLVSLLYSLPKTGGAREDVISLLVYGSGGGMLREIWRGWIRSGKIGRSLGSTKEGYKGVVSALKGVFASACYHALHCSDFA